MTQEQIEALAAKWRDEADGVTAMGYSQQGDRMRDCADELLAALCAAPTPPAAPPVPPTRVDELRDAASDLLASYGPASDYAEPYLAKWARLCSALAALASPVGETPARRCEQDEIILPDRSPLRAKHEALRVAVMTVYSDPDLTWPQARTKLAAALSAALASPVGETPAPRKETP